jgi:hypothetical protein
LDILAPLCDILGCQPNEPIEVKVVNQTVRKAAAGEQGGAAADTLSRSCHLRTRAGLPDA